MEKRTETGLYSPDDALFMGNLWEPSSIKEKLTLKVYVSQIKTQVNSKIYEC